MIITPLNHYSLQPHFQSSQKPMKIMFKQMFFCNLRRNNAYSNIHIEDPTRKNNILVVFLTNNVQLTRQIIITETSMSDHNIIQIETNIKIVEEKQNRQIKKSNLSYRDMNCFNETSVGQVLMLTCSTQAGTCF